MIWTEKYGPKKIEEFVGNEEAREKIVKWAYSWDNGQYSKPLIIYGPSGTGKTSFIKTLSLSLNWNIIQSDASDPRSTEEIIRKLGGSSKDVFGSMRLIVFDEIEVGGDRGFISKLSNLTQDLKIPIIFICNDYWEQKLSSLRSQCTPIEFKSINKTAILKKIQEIANKEKITGDLEAIAENCKGDLRAAILDLQSSKGEIHVSERFKEQKIFQVLPKIFRNNLEESLKAIDSLQIDFDSLELWIEENIPRENINSKPLNERFENLVKADIMKARIRKRNNWTFLRYRRVYLGGMNTEDNNKKFVAYSFPEYLKQNFISRRMLFNAIKKTSLNLHCSRNDAWQTLAILGKKNVNKIEFLEEKERELLFS
ncbi:Replication factor C large subunit [uncultured archaeon]|nr:Replication factor C large subunit [uncultured archaeon]